MFRWIAVGFASMLLAGCSSASKPLENVLPGSLAGWTRVSSAPFDSASTPDIVRQLGVKQAVTATYNGPVSVTVRVYEMNVPTSAFELIQKWPQQNGLAVYSGPYFVVAAPGSPPQAAALLEALRKQLN